MLISYIKTTLRSLARHKFYVLIEIFSLAVGLMSAIMILLWVMDEVSYDKFHKNADDIYRVMNNYTYPDGRIETHSATSALIKEAIQNEVPEVAEIVQLSMDTEILINHERNAFNERGLYADSNLFSIFSFPLLKGNHSDPLPGIHSIAISEKLAEKLFGLEDPIGKSLRIDRSHDFIVSAVFAEIPKNSSLQFDFVLPFALFVNENPWTQHWRSGGTRTMLTLKPAASLASANTKLAGLVNKNCEECMTSPFLFHYANSRLYSQFENGKSAGGRIEQVILFSIVAIIILMMACINFMNLTTARSDTRSREVGVRKLVGARRSVLIGRFIGESVLLSLIALFIALTAVHFLLPIFNEITDKSVNLDFTNPVFIGGALTITLASGLLAGSYPAFFLSAYNPLSALKGGIKTRLSGHGLRRALVVIQFVTAIILVAGSMVIYKQISFISEKNLGFEKENIVVLNRNESIGNNYTAFKNDLLQLPFISSIGFGGSNIFRMPITTTDPVWPNKPENSAVSFKLFRCDEGFIPTLNIELLAGRNFSDAGNDTSNFILNKMAMEVMGLTSENVIGTDMELWNLKGKVIGLTDDFHNDNLRNGIEPLIFLYSADLGNHYFIKIDKSSSTKEAMDAIAGSYKKYSPDYPFAYSFLDETYEKEYREEAVIGKLSLGFTGIALLISCLGLFGLASFAAEKRTKELGIRKVLGATASGIVVLLSKDFVKLILIAFLIASPIAWWAMNRWLEDFAYRIEIQWWVFGIAGLTAVVIALITVSWQAIRVAVINPVDSLRDE